MTKFFGSCLSKLDGEIQTEIYTRDWNYMCMINDIVVMILFVKDEQVDINKLYFMTIKIFFKSVLMLGQ